MASDRVVYGSVCRYSVGGKGLGMYMARLGTHILVQRRAVPEVSGISEGWLLLRDWCHPMYYVSDCYYEEREQDYKY